MCGNQSRGGLERCLDSVTNHSSLGQPEREEMRSAHARGRLATPRPFPHGSLCGLATFTFELWDLPGGALGQPLVAGIAGQRHGNAAAAQQKPNLLTTGILRTTEQTGEGRQRRHQRGVAEGREWRR